MDRRGLLGQEYGDRILECTAARVTDTFQPLNGPLLALFPSPPSSSYPRTAQSRNIFPHKTKWQASVLLQCGVESCHVVWRQSSNIPGKEPGSYLLICLGCGYTHFFTLMWSTAPVSHYTFIIRFITAGAIKNCYQSCINHLQNLELGGKPSVPFFLDLLNGKYISIRTCRESPPPPKKNFIFLQDFLDILQ